MTGADKLTAYKTDMEYLNDHFQVHFFNIMIQYTHLKKSIHVAYYIPSSNLLFCGYEMKPMVFYDEKLTTSPVAIHWMYLSSTAQLQCTRT